MLFFYFSLTKITKSFIFLIISLQRGLPFLTHNRKNLFVNGLVEFFSGNNLNKLTTTCIFVSPGINLHCKHKIKLTLIIFFKSKRSSYMKCYFLYQRTTETSLLNCAKAGSNKFRMYEMYLIDKL